MFWRIKPDAGSQLSLSLTIIGGSLDFHCIEPRYIILYLAQQLPKKIFAYLSLRTDGNGLSYIFSTTYLYAHSRRLFTVSECECLLTVFFASSKL